MKRAIFLRLNKCNNHHYLKTNTWFWERNNFLYQDYFLNFFCIEFISACLLYITTGSAVVWTSPSLPKLKIRNGPENPLVNPITLYEEALIGSIHPLGVCLGIFLGKFPDILGRKRTAIIIGLVELISLLILAFADTVFIICLMRLLQGMCISACIIVIPTFISEITQDHNRGQFGSFTQLFMKLGNLYGFLMGYLLNMTFFTIMCAVPLMICIPILIFFIPESPIYLLLERKPSQAKVAFSKFYSITLDEAEIVVSETVVMLNEINHEKKSFFKMFTARRVRKSLIIGVCLFLFHELTGIFVIIS